MNILKTNLTFQVTFISYSHSVCLHKIVSNSRSEPFFPGIYRILCHQHNFLAVVLEFCMLHLLHVWIGPWSWPFNSWMSWCTCTTYPSVWGLKVKSELGFSACSIPTLLHALYYICAHQQWTGSLILPNSWALWDVQTLWASSRGNPLYQVTKTNHD